MSQRRKRSLSSSSSSAEGFLPRDVVLDILTRLPVKSLIRFTSVCKSWYFSITDCDFAVSHLNQAKLSSNNDMNNGYVLYISESWETLPYREELCTVVCNKDCTFSTEVSRFEVPLPGASILGSCNGLLCLYSNEHRIVYLWNPIIGKYKLVTGTCLKKSDMVALGFTYDSQKKDYKIIRLGVVLRRTQAELYTLSTGSWREIELSMKSLTRFGTDVYEFYNAYRRPSTFVNGALHWMTYASRAVRNDRDYPDFILSFDVSGEEFIEIMLPPNYSVGDLGDAHLAECKGLLNLIAFRGYEGWNGNYCIIWAMREYGVIESWTKQVVLALNMFPDLFCGITHTHQMLLLMGRWLLLFDPVSQDLNGVEKDSTTTWEVVYTTNMMESLILC